MMTRLLAVGTLSLGALALSAGLAPSAQPAGGEKASAAGGAFKVDSVHSAVIFKISHNNAGTFFGRFNGLAGDFNLGGAGDGKGGSMNFTIPVEKVDTANDGRDKHLRSADFFNVKQFPTAAFKSTSVEKSGDGMKVKGDLTVCGVTKPVTVDVTNVRTGKGKSGEVGGFEARFTINRHDFGMTKFDDMLGTEVTIMIGVEGGR